MNRSGSVFLVLFAIIAAYSPIDSTAQELAKANAFARVAASRIESKPSIRGADENWFFLVQELRHLAKERFWEKSWGEVAANASDPVPSVVEFHRMLEERGIQLLLVPIPAKAAIYPEKLDPEYAPGDAHSVVPFLKRIEEAGVAVLELESAFLQSRRESPSRSLYCGQDSHYSPSAIELVSEQVVARLGLSPQSSDELEQGEVEELRLVGDQVKGSEWEGGVSEEVLPVRIVSQGGEPGVEPDPASPVLVMGDSHTLVFQEGKEAGMHCRGAGLSDQISCSLGQAVDLVGVRGSGMVQARKKLFFRAAENPGYWDKKRFVVWVFSVREFTQSTDKPAAIPLDRG